MKLTNIAKILELSRHSNNQVTCSLYTKSGYSSRRATMLWLGSSADRSICPNARRLQVQFLVSALRAHKSINQVMHKWVEQQIHSPPKKNPSNQSSIISWLFRSVEKTQTMNMIWVVSSIERGFASNSDYSINIKVKLNFGFLFKVI